MNFVAFVLAIVAFVISVSFAPLVRMIALRLRLTDAPDGNRKVQKSPVALGGGVVVYLSLALISSIIVLSPRAWELHLDETWADVWGFGGACTLIVLVGLLDDCFGLRGRHKLIGQVIAASCLIMSGLVVRNISLFGQSVDLGIMSIPFTMFWLLGAINAINLLDGIDGLATLVGIILTATIGIMAAMTGNYGVAVIAAVLTGSLAGFLTYNLPPARMYLGDAGSMLIGLLVGAMAVRALLKTQGTLLLAAPMAIWAIPILDSGAAILRRRLTGRSVYATDRGHLHHRLLQALGSNTAVLVIVGLCCVMTSGGALVAVWRENDTYAVVPCLVVIGMLVVTGAFGRAELRLLVSRFGAIGTSLAHPTAVSGVRESSVRLQGSHRWDILWDTLTESAEKLKLCRVLLDVNAPALHESYVATWEHADARVEPENCWRLDLPLSIEDMRVGHLRVTGLARRDGRACLGDIVQLLDLLDPFEVQMVSITAWVPKDEVVVEST